MRKAKLHRKTAETEIRIALTIEGRGKYDVSTGIRFLDHMLELFTRHGGFDLKLAALGIRHYYAPFRQSLPPRLNRQAQTVDTLWVP